MNVIYVQRLTHDLKPTIGIATFGKTFLGFTLEDRPREVKVPGDTCIPSGCYMLRWRQHGKWAARFREWGFTGSLELINVEGFTDVLIHAGNTKRDTAGCLLLGPGLRHERPNDRSFASCREGAVRAGAVP